MSAAICGLPSYQLPTHSLPIEPRDHSLTTFARKQLHGYYLGKRLLLPVY